VADAFALTAPGWSPPQTHKMIKTFSISALFFMTLGVACATHMGLPF
jgi:hypothetical protein